jgi:hypothetical protein
MEYASRLSCIAPTVANLARPRRFELALWRDTEDFAQNVNELEDRRLGARSDVKNLASGRMASCGKAQRLDDIGYKREVARLESVAIDDRRVAARECGNEPRHHCRVLR